MKLALAQEGKATLMGRQQLQQQVGLGEHKPFRPFSNNKKLYSYRNLIIKIFLFSVCQKLEEEEQEEVAEAEEEDPEEAEEEEEAV
jgi:hypothetical protein